eukprot:146446_1
MGCTQTPTEHKPQTRPTSRDKYYSRLFDHNPSQTDFVAKEQTKEYGAILVFGYVRQIIENKYLSLIIAADIKDVIHSFWGSWIDISVGDIIDAKYESNLYDMQRWHKVTIVHHKLPQQPIPPLYPLPHLTNLPWTLGGIQLRKEAEQKHHPLEGIVVRKYKVSSTNKPCDDCLYVMFVLYIYLRMCTCNLLKIMCVKKKKK